jgi:bidirectional [NiFe] hydrogenase diaphorase subunit
MGTACYIKGAAQLLSAVHDRWGVGPGETTHDGKLSLITARCLGSCGLAPAAVLDGEVAAKVTPAGLLDKVGQWWGRPAIVSVAVAKAGSTNGQAVLP